MFLVCGEALFDFFLESESGPGAAQFAARAGGSPFNVAIGLARLDQESALLTGISRDLLGRRLRQVLLDEGVSLDYAITTDRRTTVSLVGLDKDGIPAYQFYGAGSADTGVNQSELPVLGDDVSGLHFGSYPIVAVPVADAFSAIAHAESKRFISLDPNIRPTIEPDMDVWRWRVDALLPIVDLLKSSSEDLGLLYPDRDVDTIAQGFLEGGARLVVITDGAGAARAWSASGLSASSAPPQVTVVDTVGAGDTFQAAMLATLLASPEGPRTALSALDQAGLEAMLDYAARAAAITCSRRGADLPRAADLAN